MFTYDRKNQILVPAPRPPEGVTKNRVVKAPRNQPLHRSRPTDYILEQVGLGVRFIHVRVPGSKERIHTYAYTYDHTTGQAVVGRNVWCQDAPIPEDVQRAMAVIKTKTGVKLTAERGAPFNRQTHNVTAAVRRQRRPETVQLQPGLKNEQVINELFSALRNTATPKSQK